MSDDPRVPALSRLLGGLVVSIKLNHNARTLLSLRGSRRDGLRLSLHEKLLDHPRAILELPGWIRSHGRQTTPLLRDAIDTVFREITRQRRATPLAVPEFAPLAGPLDLQRMYDEIHTAWFPHLTKPPVAWGPRRRSGPRRRIRFAAYHRRPGPRIIVNRLLDQPWVAREFIAYVLYHELCHHAQACAPVRGETPHSKRFKEWEARYPRFRELLVWEKAHLDRFLDGPEAQQAVAQAKPV